VTKTKEYAEGTCPLVYQCRLPLSTRTVNHLAGLLRRHLKAIRSRWRILPPGRIAVIVLAVLRHDQRLADMAGGNDVSESTVRRWRDELITLLAAQAPRLDRALHGQAEDIRPGQVPVELGAGVTGRKVGADEDAQDFAGHQPEDDTERLWPGEHLAQRADGDADPCGEQREQRNSDARGQWMQQVSGALGR
jgi:hypothetical protein